MPTRRSLLRAGAFLPFAGLLPRPAAARQADATPWPTAGWPATVCRAVGIDPAIQNMSNVGRPIRLVDPEAKPIDEALA